MSFICFVPGLPFRGVTEETCLGEVAGSGHTAGLEGLIKGSELPGVGPVGLRRGLSLGVLAQEGVDVLNININKIKMKVSTWRMVTNRKKRIKKKLNTKKASHSSKQPSALPFQEERTATLSPLAPGHPSATHMPHS